MPTLNWPAKPKRSTHSFLGPCQKWYSVDSDYCVTRYTQSKDGKPFTLTYLSEIQTGLPGDLDTRTMWTVVSRHSTLNAAQEAANKHSRNFLVRAGLKDQKGKVPRG